jgi:hypothetical protein
MKPERPVAPRGWRRAFLALLALALLLPAWSGPHPAAGSGFQRLSLPAGIAPDPVVQQIVEKVTASDLYAYTAVLTGANPAWISGSSVTLTNRNTYSTMLGYAVQYAQAEFQAFGLQVTTHTWNQQYAPNLVAEQPGLPGESCLYLLTAHLDNMPPAEIAPGADDNASGSAAVLTAARLLSRFSFRCTLRYVLFTGEEQGLLGSQAYAAQRWNMGEHISGVINLDMIGFNSDNEPTFDLYASSLVSGSVELAHTFEQVVSAYGLDLEPRLMIDDELGSWSDNKSFWDQGYPAILVIEDWRDHTPHYHLASDTITTLNFPYFTALTQAAAGALLHLAELQQGGIAGYVVDDAAQLPLPGVLLRATSAKGDMWTGITAAGGSYHILLPSGVTSLRAEKEGFFPPTQTGINVLPGSTTAVNFRLRPALYFFLPVQFLRFSLSSR